MHKLFIILCLALLPVSSATVRKTVTITSHATGKAWPSSTAIFKSRLPVWQSMNDAQRKKLLKADKELAAEYIKQERRLFRSVSLCLSRTMKLMR